MVLENIHSSPGRVARKGVSKLYNSKPGGGGGGGGVADTHAVCLSFER